MILDLEGATTDPSRRTHVAALSASAAAVSLVLLIALFVPAPRSDVQQVAASAAPSAARMTVTFASDSAGWAVGSGRVTYDEALRNNETSTHCAAGIGSSPPIYLVFDRDGRPIAAYTSGKTGRFIPLPEAYVRSGWLTVPCDTSDVFAPRLNRAR